MDDKPRIERAPETAQLREIWNNDRPLAVYRMRKSGRLPQRPDVDEHLDDLDSAG